MIDINLIGVAKASDLTAEIANRQTAINAAVTALKDGVATQGDTLQKLYNLILGQSREITVATIAARNAYNVTSLPTNVFVQNDGDGNWALYKAITTGVSATYLKLSDPDLLNALMSASQIKVSYESNTDTNCFTNALKAKLDSINMSAIPAANIVVDSARDFVTAAEKLVWSRKSNVMVAYKNTDTTYTGTTTEVVMIGDLLIPASEITANSKIQFDVDIFAITAIGTKTYKIYLSRTQNTISGATLMATYVAPAGELSKLGVLNFCRQITCKNNTALNNIATPSAPLYYDGQSAAARSALNWDFGINTYVIITGQLSSASTTIGIDNVQIIITNP